MVVQGLLLLGVQKIMRLWPKTKNNDGKIMTKKQLIEAMRIAYISGINDEQNGGGQWCRQGSEEKAEELLEELVRDGEITPDMIT